MIGVRTAWAWVISVGNDVDTSLPSADAIERHIDHVHSNGCRHEAIRLGRSLELIRCEQCGGTD
jgi:hypothetical protein